MKSNTMMKRLLSVFLVLCMISAWILPASAQQYGVSFTQVSNDRVSANVLGKDPVELEEESQYADDEIVRVSIFVDGAGVLDAGFAAQNLATNQVAMAYRQQLQANQDALVEKIEKVLKEDLDVVWNLTLATNLISANVKYGQIAQIEKISGVSEVVIETVYSPDVVSSSAADPNMATSSVQTGTIGSYAAGYTGAGSKVAIIDTGLDIQHLSFDASAYEYSLSLLAKDAGMSTEEYMASLDLLDVEDIAAVLSQLNVASRMSKATAEDLYISSKIPFGFNYVDKNLNVEHLKDTGSEHGSHVAGIATANAYIPNGDGTFANAMEEVFVQGVAPDAQVIVMKVFGAGGGAYDTDYMAAIEDAILLGADSVNLSLGSGNPGMSRNSNAKFQAILEGLEKCGVVVAMSAGNAYAWMDFAENGVPYMYLDDVSMQTDGSPGSFTNSLAVASVDNAGYVYPYIPALTVNGRTIFYTENTAYAKNQPFATLVGEHEFVFLNGIGTPEEFAALGEGALEGKIAICYRGTTSFFEKANAAVEAGAIGVIIVNNQSGVLGLNLTGYNYTAPVVSVLQTSGEAFKLSPIMGDEDVVLGWTGALEVPEEAFTGMYEDAYYTMSEFSSWGVPGSLELKPEITAPGGDILSVAGAYKDSQYGNLFTDHASYEVMGGTSMASPQVAGMVALLAQYIRENNLEELTGLDARTLAQSLLMSTSVPVLNAENEYYYSVMKQGSGLANVGAAVMADSYILMNSDATNSWADGKVKVELGDDPAKTGVYTFSFTINNLTDIAKSYVFSADFFTQGAFAYNGALYMDTLTTALQPIVVYAVDGQQLVNENLDPALDLNGDGFINPADGYYLLECVLSGAEISTAADLDGNGVVTSYDGYLFFVELGECSAVVPANGSVNVEVTVTLSQSDREWLSYYENGAYLEGYVYAESLTTEEGVEGTTHSIPVLGFYGNWSDPSMFEKGSYEEYALSGEETRVPYLYESAFGKGNVNSLYITYAGDSSLYYFGGNPLVTDETYMPERNAISGVNGDMISKIGFTNIRNAAASFFQVLDWTNKQVLVNEAVGAVSSAYYYVNGQTWKNTYWTLGLNQSMAGIPDNTLLEVGICLIPEYYVDAEGNVDWTTLGDGTTFSMTMTVDNTAPAVQGVTIDETNNTLIVSALDNQYVAAVVLLDIYGEHIYTYVGSDAEAQPEVASDFALDLEGVGGSSFLVQVYDYAMNCSTYEINQQIGEVVDYVDSITISDTSIMLAKGNTQQLSAIVRPFNASDRGVIWTTSDEAVAVVENGKVTAVGAGTAVITATAKADETFTATCTVSVVELNSTLKGILQDEEGNPVLFTWNLAEDSTWTAGSAVARPMVNLAYDAYYDVLCGQSALDMKMYAIDPETGEMTQLSAAACAFGAAVDDLAISTCYGTSSEGYLMGVYGYYLLGYSTPSANTFTRGFNLSSLLASKGASAYVAIADYGYTMNGSTPMDCFFALDDAGNLWYLVTNGSSLSYGYYTSNLKANFPGYEDNTYCSLVTDDSGDLYLACFNGSTSDIYYLSFNGKGFDALYVGNVGADVWPVALYAAEMNVEAEPTDPAEATTKAMMDAAQVIELALESQQLSLEDLVGAETPNNSAVLDVEKNTVTVAVTAKDLNGLNVSSHNGVITVNYDPATQVLQNVIVHGDFNSVVNEDGSVTFAYVKMDGFAPSDLVATLVFMVKDETAVDVSVEYKEVDQGYDLENEVEVESDTLMQILANLEQADVDLADMIEAVRSALSGQISGTDATLRALINRVDTELSKALKDLTAAVETSDAALDEKITALNTALENAVAAYELADETLKEELGARIEDSKTALQTAIDKVASDLAAAQKDLSAAISSGDAALTTKIESLTTALDAAKAALEAADEATKAELSAKIDAASDTVDAAIEALSQELADVKAALEAKNAEQDAQLAKLNTFVIVVCVIACLSVAGCAAALVLVLKKKQ